MSHRAPPRPSDTHGVRFDRRCTLFRGKSAAAAAWTITGRRRRNATLAVHHTTRRLRHHRRPETVFACTDGRAHVVVGNNTRRRHYDNRRPVGRRRDEVFTRSRRWKSCVNDVRVRRTDGLMARNSRLRGRRVVPDTRTRTRLILYACIYK